MSVESHLQPGDRLTVETLGAGMPLEATVSSLGEERVRLVLVENAEDLLLPDEVILVFDRSGRAMVLDARVLTLESSEKGPELVLAIADSPTKGVEDIRSTFRLTVEIDAEYLVSGDTTGTVRTGQLLDLSAGGAGMALDWHDPTSVGVGDFLKVTFTLPGTTTQIKTEARVARTTPAEFGGVVGVEFRSADEKMKDNIVRWMFAEQRRRSIASRGGHS
jgi:hypothetical protein